MATEDPSVKTAREEVDEIRAAAAKERKRDMPEPVLAGGETMEDRVAAWVRSRIGEDHMYSRERAMRLLEEAVELAQAEGIQIGMIERQARHVFGRPPGEPAQEAAGVAVCLLAWCAATGHRLNELAMAEIERIEAKPLDQIRGSLARKADADLISAVLAPGTKEPLL